MKKIIRLTESELCRIIKESASRLVLEHDTNDYDEDFGDSGIHWETVDVTDDFYREFEKLSDVSDISDDELEDFYGFLDTLPEDTFKVGICIEDEESDDSTGYYPGESISDVDGTEGIEEAINSYGGSEQVKELAVSALYSAIQEIDLSDY